MFPRHLDGDVEHHHNVERPPRIVPRSDITAYGGQVDVVLDRRAVARRLDLHLDRGRFRGRVLGVRCDRHRPQQKQQNASAQRSSRSVSLSVGVHEAQGEAPSSVLVATPSRAGSESMEAASRSRASRAVVGAGDAA